MGWLRRIRFQLHGQGLWPASRLARAAWYVLGTAILLLVLQKLLPLVKAQSFASSLAGWVTFLSLVATHKVAPIVGGPTAGSNGGINVYVLPGGYRVSWTGMRATKRDGSPHHGVGVLPTVRVRRTVRAVAEGRDELVERALELVK